MRLLAVPNWSFGRDRLLLARLREALEERGLRVHYCESDVDHNRTVSAFSGGADEVQDAILDLCELAFPAIDLNRHAGVHPRTGALDVCPIVALAEPEGMPSFEAVESVVEELGAAIAGRWGLPVFLYEKSERGRREGDIPALRDGGFGSLWGRELNPDYGPEECHSQLGVALLGVRDFFIVFNVNLKPESLEVAEAIASQIRDLRAEGDPRFLGVRAIGLLLPTKEIAQVSLSATLPDLTPIDPIAQFVKDQAHRSDLAYVKAELVGPIRMRDVPGAARLVMKPAQIVDGEPGDTHL